MAVVEEAWPLVVVVQVHLLVARVMNHPAQPPQKGGVAAAAAAAADLAYSAEREAEWVHLSWEAASLEAADSASVKTRGEREEGGCSVLGPSNSWCACEPGMPRGLLHTAEWASLGSSAVWGSSLVCALRDAASGEDSASDGGA